MSYNYSLESLIEILKKHAVESDKLREESLKSFMKNNPGQPIPIPFLDDFNFPNALSIICQEILDLKTNRQSDTKE